MLKKIIFFMAVIFLFPAKEAHAISLIRDAEIEQDIRIFATPLFRAAGLNADAIGIHIVNDSGINAFVAKGRNLFVNTGLIIKCEHAGQLIGVIAHETGHLAGGHLVRLSQQMEKAQTASLITTVLGGAAMLATGRGDVGAAVMMGGLGSVTGSFFKYTQSEENSADQVAVNVLDATGQSSKGFYEFMKLIQQQERMVSVDISPYYRTHPLTKDRINFIANHVEKSPFSSRVVNEIYNEKLERMRGKLRGFLEEPDEVLTLYKETDTSTEALYARSVAFFRKAKLDKAIQTIDVLIAKNKKDAFLHELKGQFLFESGSVKESLPEYEKAVSIMPNSYLLRIGLARAQTETESVENNLKAVENLIMARKAEPENAGLWRLSAVAYGKGKQIGMAAYSMAEYNLLTGRYDEALYQCKRAESLITGKQAVLLRIDDIKNTAKARKSKKNKRKKRR